MLKCFRRGGGGGASWAMAARYDNVVRRDAPDDPTEAAEVAEARGLIPLGNSKWRIYLHIQNANKSGENGEFGRAIEELKFIQNIV